MSKYVTDIEDGVVVTRFNEKPSLEDAKSAMDHIRSMGKIKRRMWVLDDGIELSSEEVEQLGTYGKDTWPTEPSRAAIVAKDDLSFGLMRIHDVYREQEQHETRVFRTEQEANEWIRSGDIGEES